MTRMTRSLDKDGRYAWKEENVLPEVVSEKDLTKEAKAEVEEAIKAVTKSKPKSKRR